MGEIRIELEREEDGRWIAEVTAVPGVMAYGQTANDALQKVSKLLCQVLDERVSAGEITEQEAAETLKGLAA
jgi:predicted RNase H-like HicB family nuclease